MPLKVLFVSGPYRGPSARETVLNCRMAEAVAAQLWRLPGVCVVTPHLNSFLLSGIAPESHFLDGYMELVTRSDAMVMTPNWRVSEGARAERQLALQRTLPVFYWPRDRDAIAKWVGNEYAKTGID